jgi:tRNA A37 methylthiotransferase MiaB
MRKNIKVIDIERVLLETFSAGIRASCFFIAGYVNETDDDFRQTIHFIRKYHRYMDVIYNSGDLFILDESDLYGDCRSYGIEMKDDDRSNWTSQEGRNNREVRSRRAQELQELVRKIEGSKIRLMRNKVRELVTRWL